MKINIEGTPEEIKALQQMAPAEETKQAQTETKQAQAETTQPKQEDTRRPVLVRDLRLHDPTFDAVIYESPFCPRRYYTAAEARDMEVRSIQGLDPIDPGRRDHLLVIVVKDPEGTKK